MPDRMTGPTGVLLSDDLIFSSRITATARSLGLDIKVARTPGAFVELARQHAAHGVVVDLSFPGLALEALLQQLGAACPAPPRVVAYGSHVDTAILRAARAAGCDPVLPRSKFVEDLEAELPKWLAGH